MYYYMSEFALNTINYNALIILFLPLQFDDTVASLHGIGDVIRAGGEGRGGGIDLEVVSVGATSYIEVTVTIVERIK